MLPNISDIYVLLGLIVKVMKDAFQMSFKTNFKKYRIT